MNWKYKNSERIIAIRTTTSGYESVLVSSLPIGTVIDAEDPKTAEEIAYDDYTIKAATERGKALSDSVVKYLLNHTSEEINAYIQTNVTNLADVKNILAKIAIAAGAALRG